MGSFLHSYISIDDEFNMGDEDLLECRLSSPYSTLRAEDVADLLQVQVGSLGLLPTSVYARKAAGLSSDEETVERLFSHHDESTSTSTTCDGESDLVDVVCKGADYNDVPATYVIKNLKRYEMPVIGVCVDRRICPGFRYFVRRAGSSSGQHLFSGRPLTLESVGMGYGKRLTFSGDNAGSTDNFFWSDSEPNGFAFTLHAIDQGLNFTILDADGVVVGEGIVNTVHEPQVEISSTADNGNIEKCVSVDLTCDIRYHQRHHGLVDLMAPDTVERVSGEAVLLKSRSAKKANLVVIQNMFLQRAGICKFEPDV